MFVQAGLGNADFSGHLVHGHQVKTFFREQGIRCIDDSVLADDQLLLFERELGFFTHRLRFRPGSFELFGLYGTRTAGGALAVLLMVFFARKLLRVTPLFCIYIDNNGVPPRIVSDQYLSHGEHINARRATARYLTSTIGYDRAPTIIGLNS